MKTFNHYTYKLAHACRLLGTVVIFGLAAPGCYQIDDNLDTNGAVRKDDNVTADSDSATESEDALPTDSDDDTGDADTVDPNINYCLALDGDEDYVRTRQDDGLAVSGDWTMEAWVWYRNDGSVLHPILRGADESTSISSYFMYAEYDALGYGEKPMVGFGFTSTDFEYILDKGRLQTEEWMHLAFVHDGTSHRFYIDGKLIGEVISDLDARPVADDVIIGAILHPRKTGYLNGYLDDIRLSSIVRYKNEFIPKVRLEWDEDTIVLWNFDVDYGEDYTMDATGTFRSEFNGDAHIVERDWNME